MSEDPPVPQCGLVEASPRFRDTRLPDGTIDHHRCGGRAKKSIEEKYFRMFKAGCPPERFRRVVEKVVELAEAGDMKAAKLIFDRALPQDRLEDFLKLTGADGASNVAVIVMQPEDLEARKERLRQAVVK